jgi:hypothetical protein
MRTRTVDSTIETAKTAASKIQKLTSRTAVGNVSGQAAWGQFLDDQRDQQQTGVYGTSAAVELLTIAGAPAAAGVLPLARATLDSTDDVGQSSLFNDPEDPFIVHKLAALAECTPPPVPSSPLSGAAAVLVERMAPGGGWADYVGDGVAQPAPELLSTAVVLYALRRHRAFRATSECHDALKWITRELAADTELHPAVAAMSALAVLQYRSEGDVIEQLGPTADDIASRLARWAVRRANSQIGEHYECHYSVRTSTRSFKQYLFLLPDCLASLVFLHSGEPRRAVRPYLRRVANALSTNVLAADGFRSPNSLRKGTVDQFWVFRVLQTIADLGPRQLKGIDYMRPVRVSRRQLVITGALVIFTAGFGALSLSHAPFTLRVVGLVATAVLTGVLGTFATSAIRGEQ